MSIDCRRLRHHPLLGRNKRKHPLGGVRRCKEGSRRAKTPACSQPRSRSQTSIAADGLLLALKRIRNRGTFDLFPLTTDDTIRLRRTHTSHDEDVGARRAPVERRRGRLCRREARAILGIRGDAALWRRDVLEGRLQQLVAPPAGASHRAAAAPPIPVACKRAHERVSLLVAERLRPRRQQGGGFRGSRELQVADLPGLLWQCLADGGLWQPQ